MKPSVLDVSATNFVMCSDQLSLSVITTPKYRYDSTRDMAVEFNEYEKLKVESFRDTCMLLHLDMFRFISQVVHQVSIISRSFWRSLWSEVVVMRR